MRDTLIKEATG